MESLNAKSYALTPMSGFFHVFPESSVQLTEKVSPVVAAGQFAVQIRVPVGRRWPLMATTQFAST